MAALPAAPVPVNAHAAALLIAAAASPMPLHPAALNSVMTGKAVKRQREAVQAACSTSIPIVSSEELGNEAVHTLLTTLAAVPPAAIAALPPAAIAALPHAAIVPAWAVPLMGLPGQINNMQAQLNNMQAQLNNMDARIHNGLTSANDGLRALTSGVPPVVPHGFPACRHHLDKLTGPAINALLQFYLPGVALVGNIEDRRNTLKKFIGVPPI